MHLSFLTPLGALFALAAIVPLAALWLNERRARRVREALRVAGPPSGSTVATACLLASIPILLGLALSQPTIQTTRRIKARSDAQIFYTFDTSLSMAASAGPSAPTRLDRAVAEAEALRRDLADVPSGIATMTDRVLPTIFPTTDPQEFAVALANTVGIDEPPPKGLSDKATTFAALDTFAGDTFFSPGVLHRLVILFTDGETAPYFVGDLRQALRQRPKVSIVVVHVWRGRERIYHGRKADPDYRPDPRSGRLVAALAAALGGRAFGEGQTAQVAAAAKRLLGPAHLTEVGIGLHVSPLAGWLVAASAVPLLALIWRRNVA